MKKIFSFILIILVFSFGFYFVTNNNNNKEKVSSDLYNLNLDDYQNIMIVAHPDDEAIWGGSHLIKGDYLVICITNKDNSQRNKEFLAVIEASHNKGVILDYPDKTNNKRDNWEKSKKQLNIDLNYLLTKKKWNSVVTHNPDGE
ncbi:MAG: PIG-L family deacetylase, partial [Bacilli bacterium]